MDDQLDTAIKASLRASLTEFPHLSPDELADQIEGRSGARRSRRRRPRLLAVAAAASVLLVAGVIATRPSDRDDLLAAGDEPATSSITWSELPTDGLPSLDNISVASSGSMLVVAGTAPPSGADASRERVYTLSEGATTWTALPTPPLERFDLVAAGGDLVIIGVMDAETSSPPVLWSVLGAGDTTWTSPADVPPSAAGQTREDAIADAGLNSGFEAAQMVWTGTHVIDTKYAVSIDPAERTARPLETPTNTTDYRHLGTATPVWTGDALVLAAWTTLPGLAWTADGQTLREIPGLPGNLAGNEVLPTSATSVAGSVVLSTGLAEQGPMLVQLDADQSSWRPIAAPPGETDSLCGWDLASLDGHLVAQGCQRGADDPAQTGDLRTVGPAQLGDLWMLDDSGWSSLDGPPIPFACCGQRAWTAADGNLIMVGNTDATLDRRQPSATAESSDDLIAVSVSRAT